jgi:all-trans-retinol 13,14-reductase
MIVSHYMNGAWFPKGGPLSLARPLVSTIFKGGGAVLVRAPVQQIQARPMW